MYQTLYRKYRPSYFDEVVGQKIIIRTLKNAVENNTLSHAYLFTGPRGTGKTSVAKILAKTINCEHLENLVPCNKCVNCTQINNKQSVDIIEIDAASNNGVDEIRELKSKVSLVPSIGKYKIYIIDEVHMLTTGAFNALLKTLEEPPEHIIFILATTEPHKIPATILSRCQRFDFKKIHETDIYNRLKEIAKLENIEIDDDSLIEIARLADGGLRDALSLFDQVIAYSKNKIKVEAVHEINGTLTPLQLKNLIVYLSNNNIEHLFQLIDQYDQSGKNFVKLSEEIILFLRNCLLAVTVPSYLKETINNFELYEIENLNKDKILKLIQTFNQSIYDMKLSNHPKILFETTLIGFMDIQGTQVLENKIEISKEVPTKKEKSVVSLESIVVKEDNVISNEKEEMISKSVANEKIETNNTIEQLKKIRINNTLCQFNKKEFLDWKEKLSQIEMEVTNPEYGQLASLILDGNLKAVGHHHLIFVYESDRLSNLFNETLPKIDQLFEQTFHENLFTIATDQENWDIIKKEFNSKTKKYQYIEEPKQLIEQLEQTESLSEIENLFNNIIEYEK